MSWDMIVILISIAAAIFGLYREYRRVPKRYLWLRIAAIIIAITTLAYLALPATTGGNQATTYRQILLTDGFDKDSLQTGDSVYTLDVAIHQKHPKAKLVSDVSLLKNHAPLHVFGYGLAETGLDQLDSIAIIFHPSPIPNGIISATWTDQLKTGEPFTVQLKYKNSSGKSLKLILKGLNVTLDSAVIPANTETGITLQSTPKHSGKALYTLLAMDGKDTLQQEQLPAMILPVKPLNILMLSAAPDFESKFLKTWLGDNGYSIASRIAITKGKYSTDFINATQTDLSRLSASLLNKFDILISDQSALQSLGAAENSALQQAVSQTGLGIIIRADSTGKENSGLSREFSVNRMSDKPATPGALDLQGKIKTSQLIIDQAYINPKENQQALVTDAQQRAVAGAAMAGAGKVILTTLSNTHSWLLAGNKTDYYNLWSLLIDKAARRETESVNWQVKGELLTINTPVIIEAETQTDLNKVTINNQPVSPARDVTLPFKHTITYWPATSGWQSISSGGAAPYWWYVWDSNDWKSLQAAHKLSITEQYAKAHPYNKSATQQISDKSRAIPKFYFFILFLMAATFLWAERKFINT